MSPLFPSYQAAAEYRRDMAIIPDAPHGHTSHRRRRKSRRKRMGEHPAAWNHSSTHPVTVVCTVFHSFTRKKSLPAPNIPERNQQSGGWGFSHSLEFLGGRG